MLLSMPSMLKAQGSVSTVWCADLGNGKYQNPIIHADYSDPDICRVGDDYFLTASSFNCIPGLPILHSKDLVNWEIVNYALRKQVPEETYNTVQHAKGVWAPSIRYFKGTYYIYWGDPDYGIYMVKTTNPYGTWEEPVLVKAGKGLIDTTPLFDEDGKNYLVFGWANSRSGINSILSIVELNEDGSKAITEPVMVYDGSYDGNFTVEGPKLYKKDGYYWIFAPAGGVEFGWQLAMRSKNIYGPYECRTVMKQGKTDINGPHQGGWTDTSTGEYWFINFQDYGAYGRMLHLNPMVWKEGWPVIGTDKDGDGCGEPVRTYKKPNVGMKYPIQTPVDNDEFNEPKIGNQWSWHANYNTTFGQPTAYGYMRLYAYHLSKDFVNFWEVPNLFTQKFMGPQFTATAKVRFSDKREGDRGGLIIMGSNYSYLSITSKGEEFVLEQIICKKADKGGTEQHIEIATFPAQTFVFNDKLKQNYLDLFLQVKVSKGAQCRFAYSTDGKKFTTVGESFTAVPETWIGSKVGFFCVTPTEGKRAWLDIDWFHVTK